MTKPELRRTLAILLAAALFCTAGLLGLACSAWATTGEHGSLPRLDEILKRTEKRYSKTGAFTARFRQETTSAAAGSLTTKATGVFFYQRPRQMRWQYQEPEPQVFIANGSHAWLHVPEDFQINLFDAEEVFSSPLSRALLEGAVELKKYFKVSLNTKQSSPSEAVLDLVPLKEDPNVNSVMLRISLEDYRITGVDTRDALGNLNRLSFADQKDADHLDAKLFHLEVPDDTVVFDPNGQPVPEFRLKELQLQLSSR